MLRKTAVLAFALCFALQGAAQEGVYINGSDTLHYSYTPLPEQPQPQKRLSFPRRVVKYFEGSTRDRTFEKKIDSPEAPAIRRIRVSASDCWRPDSTA